MKLYEALADAFIAEGATDVFGMSGGQNIHWLSALQERGGRFFQVRHEGAGLAMADGWARMKGSTPGVCTSTGGPGAAQLSTTMMVASRARTPLVALSGDVATGELTNAQYMDQKRYAEAIEAGYVRIHSAEEAYAVVQRAFYLARYESRPIMLNVPSEVTKQEVDDLDEYVPSTALLARTHPVHPHPQAIAEAVDAIGKSERPVIIVGRGAMWAGVGPAVVALADRVGAVIATTLMAKNWLGDHPYHAGISGLFATKTAIELFQEADCVLAIGASLNHYTTEHGYLFPNATYVHVDVQHHAVMGDGRSADVYVQADAGLALEAINTALEDEKVASRGFRTDEVRIRLGRATDDPRSYDIPQGTLDPRDAARTLDEAMPPDVGMVLGGGQQNHFGIMLCNRQRTWLLPNLHFACLGEGLPTAIGAVVATGGGPAFLMEGDGGFMMHLAEFETAVRYRIPLFVAIFNDQGFNAERQHYGAEKDVDLDIVEIPSPDLGSVGIALGGRGALVTTVDDLRKAAEAFATDPATTLVDVRVAKTVASIPNRRRYHGEEDQ